MNTFQFCWALTDHCLFEGRFIHIKDVPQQAWEMEVYTYDGIPTGQKIKDLVVAALRLWTPKREVPPIQKYWSWANCLVLIVRYRLRNP